MNFALSKFQQKREMPAAGIRKHACFPVVFYKQRRSSKEITLYFLTDTYFQRKP